MAGEALLQSIKEFAQSWTVEELRFILPKWAERHGYHKRTGKGDNSKVYEMFIDGNNDKIQFFIYNDWIDSQGDLAVVLRRGGGHYVIFGRSNCDLAVDLNLGWPNDPYFDYEKMKELLAAFPDLFIMLGVKE